MWRGLIPGVDYTVSGTQISYTTAPRTKLPADDVSATYITYLNGFVENSILALDNLSNGFGEGKTSFKLTRNGESMNLLLMNILLQFMITDF